MAELSTLARPYAKAAFNAALDSKQLDAWSTQLSTLAAISQHETVDRLIANPELSAADKVRTLQQLAGDALNEGGSNLVSVLAENRRLALLTEISEQFEVLKAEQEKTADVLVTSAFSLSDSQQKTLADKLTAKFSRQVQLTVEIDESLLGGVVIRSGDTVIDGSVRGKLAKLAEAMNS
ncbi:F0F1 ATP synthase subunit delta [Saccharospirillum sp.]|uniref:F0F1 ATP synthase subunit delta n=1 Tax=Saccharospirillum sp. TaxID=2033801 RepID=UPI00349FFC80